MDKNRYKRNIQLPEIGITGQEKLLKSSVMIVGCGAIGSVIATYLCASGTGRIGISDFDTIDVSNLQRQVFYHTSLAGKSKAYTLARHLADLNPDSKIEIFNFSIDSDTDKSMFEKFDLIIDASDNPKTKYTVSQISSELSKPYIIGGVNGFQGQISTITDLARGYTDIFGGVDESVSIADTSKGVFGPAAGTVGCIVAGQAIKLLTSSETIKNNSILTVDLLTMEFNNYIM